MKKTFIFFLKVFITWFFITLVIFIICIAKKNYADNKIRVFDLNGDGIYSKEEQTEQWEHEFYSLMGDNSLFGLYMCQPLIIIFSLLLNVFLVIMKKIFNKLVFHIKKE